MGVPRRKSLTPFTPILSCLPGVREKLAHPLGGEKVRWTFSGFRLSPREGGRDVLFLVLVQRFPKGRGVHGLKLCY